MYAAKNMENGPGMTNKLYYGDNLQVLRESIKDESVDLVYLDPPFNSASDYNILFKSPKGVSSQAQIEAFKDTWHWGPEAEDAFDDVMKSGNVRTAELLRAMRAFLRENDMMAYLTMMAARLLELHRILKPTGSLYLHCDPTASHYLKILLDSVFDVRNFRNEIIWQRQSAHSDARKKFASITDTILFYAKSDLAPFYVTRRSLDPSYQDKFYRHQDENGRFYRLDNMASPKPRPNMMYEWKGYPHPTKGWRYSKETMAKLDAEGRINYPEDKSKRLSLKRYLDEGEGHAVGNVWTDINSLSAANREALGYPTQKPLALLERIIEASSNEGDVVLDPFCGCGTAVHAAEKLGRQWIGIDITHLAISLIEKRLKDAFPGIVFETHGTPKDLEGARALAEADKYQFQWWAVSLVNAVPYGGKKKGADSGIDGHIYFKPDGKTTEKAIVSVKGGDSVSVPMIRDLAHVVERENAKIGLFITLAEPTGPMQVEAVKAGYYETDYGKYPKIQILTLRELFEGKQPNIPLIDPTVFKKAATEARGKQEKLL